MKTKVAGGIAVVGLTMMVMATAALGWHIETPPVEVAVATDCSQVATLTIVNPAWRWGSEADAVIVASDHPDVIEVGHHITIQEPYVIETPITDTTVFNFSVAWVGNDEAPMEYALTAVFDTSCVPPCPPDTHQVGQTNSVPPRPICEPDEPPTTEPPTSLLPPTTVSRPAVPVQTSPVVTG